ncbi:hypothetical protein SCLCIDRAFT_1217331 [Scleroderma citrinum Foug A]|uniref:Uncharacterized protein n=1 Tax=Scleroderma citrinum Foug A TaxID=1036808 RepID=A0A0C3DUM9_9AGAM|nr:hypothetical protein SCLCIDRAFT_1217331 [Scleroderma citrinum Foug A]
MLRLHFKSASAFFFNWTTRLGSWSWGGLNSSHPAILSFARRVIDVLAPCTTACSVKYFVLGLVFVSQGLDAECNFRIIVACPLATLAWSAVASKLASRSLEGRKTASHCSHAPGQRHGRSNQVCHISGFPSATL